MSIQQYTAGESLLMQAGGLAELVTHKQYELQPDLLERFGDNGKIKTKQDSIYSLNYLAESVIVNSPILFTYYVSWLKRLLEGFGITQEDLIINFQLIRETLVEHFHHTDKTTVLMHLELGIQQIGKKEEYASFITDDNPYAADVAQYLEYLLLGNRRQALDWIVHLLDEGTSIQHTYKYIFQISQYEIGRLWHEGKITVGQEHFCTAATQFIISSLYPRWIGTGNKGRNLVAACVGSEQHEIGLRMLADIFEMDGWDTYYLGANVPDRSLLQAIVSYNADVVAISATMAYHVHLVKKLITVIRQNTTTRHVKIMVGGLPFNLDSHLWQEVGADGYAPGAEEALEVAEGILSLKR
ncbi:cobalamin-dependent protein [Paenibacillus sp. M-152]|uniref:cobalamin B12-binding domain-containing protein n=1 Tax=Paenibacillus sp. M-152 TaxID=2487928 RepID=UPI000F70E354|nr:cobalamin-dependent protein [Paenibacillus sp. M-152]AZH29014.1 cobalamin-binding protein [Paenibacillus sp. M-152]